MVWYSHLLRVFQFVVIHTVKGFGIVNKAEVEVLLDLFCFFNDPRDVGNSISGFSKSSLNNWKFPVHVLLKSVSRSLTLYRLDYIIYNIYNLYDIQPI